MEGFKIENLSFIYPGREEKTLDSVSLEIKKGAFVTVIGASGSGKTTLLKLLKPELSPYGEKTGEIFFNGEALTDKVGAQRIGFVMQNPDNQIVTDKVWHELSFGLESIGTKPEEIRKKVAEAASFFGLQDVFYSDVSLLSGGQNQLLNLASVMVTEPEVLILDEPSAQLDPIARDEFFNVLVKLNREIGTTVILAEHSLESVFPVSTDILVLDGGKVISKGEPGAVARELKENNHKMYGALPSPARVFSVVEPEKECPLTVGEGKRMLSDFADRHGLHPEAITKREHNLAGDDAITLKDVWFRYGKELPDVIKGICLTVKKGSIYSLLGGNGTGKSTTLSLISGIKKPYRGKIMINGRGLDEIKNPYDSLLGVLPQDPRLIFSENSVYLDLLKRLSESGLSDGEKHEKVILAARKCRVSHLLESHPYDLSGGEIQRAALAKVLLGDPGILLLDEPTKGMDAFLKAEFADILNELKENGAAILMVTHDTEFAAEYSDECALFFDGAITSHASPEEFFSCNSFYTTAANRMARGIIPGVLTAEDIISSCLGRTIKKEKREIKKEKEPDLERLIKKEERKKPGKKRIALGCIFLALFISFPLIAERIKALPLAKNTVSIVSIIFFAAALVAFFPGREIGIDIKDKGKKLDKRTYLSIIPILILIPLTVYSGIRFFGDRKYYFISLLIITEAMIPFFLAFEKRRQKAKEIVIISVLSAIAVAGRSAFYMTMQFKPVAAIVIIAGLSLGPEAGFLVGAVTALCSNMFFGQGPWTPWQMFAFGIIGFLSGVLFKKGLLGRTRAALSVYGFIVTLVLYGLIMNFSYVVQSQAEITAGAFAAAIISGLPFDVVHASSSAFFLWFFAEPMVYKIERVKLKYGI